MTIWHGTSIQKFSRSTRTRGTHSNLFLCLFLLFTFRVSLSYLCFFHSSFGKFRLYIFFRRFYILYLHIVYKPIFVFLLNFPFSLVFFFLSTGTISSQLSLLLVLTHLLRFSFSPSFSLFHTNSLLPFVHDPRIHPSRPSTCNQLPDNLSHFFSVFLFYILLCLYSYITIFPTIYALNSSNFLHFFTNNNWIVAPNFLSAHFSVIELAIVLVTVSMHRAEQSSTTAFESC